MRDYAEICELCDQMQFLINYAGSHYCTLSEVLFEFVAVGDQNEC